jgi:BirA family biotin operon repressor/biotin-[acetyl-CoA-carboxylase] ligase
LNFFNPEKFKFSLKTRRFGQELHCFESTESTQNLARGFAGQGSPEGSLVLASHQSAGRGRQGRAWQSPAGKNLLFSIVLRPPHSCRPSQLPLVIGLGLLEALELSEARLKWPNDIWVGGRKLAGILVEGSADFYIAGIGMNVNMGPRDFPQELLGRATSLEIEVGATLELEPLLARLLGSMESCYERWISEGFETIKTSWLGKSLFLDEKVRVGENEGVFRGIDAVGALILEQTGGLRTLYSGELEPLRPVLD